MPAPHIFSTKFEAPFLRPRLLRRDHLLQKLERGIASGSRLTLISAPAGYGKTTLAAAWLQAHPNATWLILDEGDDHPVRFFACLIGALQKLDPGLGATTQSLFDMAPRPPASALMEELVNDIALSTQPIILVLDDYHTIHNTEIHEAIEALILHQPATLHLVLTTREDPPFPVGRLRARGQITEIRLRDLRFLPDEVEALMEESTGQKLPAESVAALERITEGWAAGLQLAGFAIQSGEDAAGLLETFSGEHQYIIDYLMEEVLRHLPEDLQTFLRWASIVDRFNAGLCGALVDGEIDAQAALTYLDRANLFVIPLDANRQWYRFHRLFADVLRSSLEKEEQRLLNQRAAAWYERQGMAADAIQHYLACEQMDNASRLIQQSSIAWLNQGEMHTLLRWIRALPPAEVLSNSGLAGVQALALIMTGEISQAAGLLQRVDQGAAGSTTQETGRLLAVRALFSMITGKAESAAEMARQAIDTLPAADTVFRGLALMALGSGYQAAGELAASNEAFEEVYHTSLDHGSLFPALSALANIAFNLYDLGQLQRARFVLEDAVAHQVDARGRPLPVLAAVYMPLSTFCLEQYDIPAARDYANRGMELCQRLFTSGMMGGDAEQSLAEIAFLEGDVARAFSILESTRQFAREKSVPFLEHKMTLLETRFFIRMGEMDSARGALERLESAFSAKGPAAQRGLKILHAEILLAEGKPRQALDTLDETTPGSGEIDRTPRQIHLYLLRSACLFLLKNEAGGLEAMEKALHLAAPEGYRMSFVWQPPCIHAHLPHLRGAAPRFVDELRDLLPQPAPGNPASPPATYGNAVLPEPLSEQERKILRLIAAGLSNQQIAEALVISVGTAKWHVHNILGKLGVSNRSQAIARANALKIDHLP